MARHAGFKNLKDSIAAIKHKPSAYDILACLSSYYPETFEDFCSEFGYDEQSLSNYPKVMEIFTACKAEERGLRQLFNDDELEQLSEIA